MTINIVDQKKPKLVSAQQSMASMDLFEADAAETQNKSQKGSIKRKVEGDNATALRRSTFKKNSKVLAGKPKDISDLFDYFDEIKKEQK